jgi:hypothetical protein
MQTMVHELGHWLLGRPHPYNGTTIFGKHAYWGLLCSGNRVASCANAYERERLGWIVVPEILPDQNTILADYVPSGVAYKYHPANGYPFEYFYIENHQQVSVFDDVTINPEDKGVWVLHQQGHYLELDNLKIRPSDGYWKWENPGSTTSCFAQQLPVFERGIPKILMGVSHRDQIPTPTSIVNWMFAYKDDLGHLNCGVFSRGEMFAGAFRANDNPIFSPYSNPTSRTWDNLPTQFSFEILNELDGVVTVRYNSNPLDAAPARRYLGPNPSGHDTLPGWVSLAWGVQWAEGQDLETDVDWSELQRKVGTGANWTSVYVGSLTSWSDGSIYYDTNGTTPVSFRARVHDTQGKYSAWSNIFHTATFTPNGVIAPTMETSDGYRLETNYPNPFNPSTMIRFTLAEVSHVQLSIIDTYGREVRRLADSPFSKGSHIITWDGTNNSNAPAASGVYFCRLFCRLGSTSLGGQAGSFMSVKKMVLLR